jgi:Xaa-Pro dipeptidase
VNSHLQDPAVRRFVDEQNRLLAAREPSYAFEPGEYQERLERLRAAMEREHVDLLLMSSPDGMCWLHGHRSRWYRTHGPTSWPPLQCTAVHVDHDAPIHFDSADHGELVRLNSVARDVRLIESERLDEGLGFVFSELQGAGWLRGTAGLERWSSLPNPAVSDAVRAALERAGCTVRDASQMVRALRRVKSPAELAKIEEAAAVCDAGLRALQQALTPGITELEAWAAMMSAMAAAGGEHAAIHENVVIGPSSLGHALSSRRAVQAGDYVFADPCGVVDRYHANAARHFVVGDPSEEALRVAEVQAGAYDVLRAEARAGAVVGDVNRALRAYYREAGTWGMHEWTGGYELGLSFPPDWVGEWLFTVDDEQDDRVFEAGLVTNFESMVQPLASIDTVVYEEGGARTLSSIPHEVLVAGGS